MRALDDVLALHTMRFHDEVVDADDLDLAKVRKKPSKREVRDGAQAGRHPRPRTSTPAAYEDTYRDAVLDLIKRKAKGEEIDLAAQEEPEQGDDLMAALEASVSGGR